MALTTLTNVSPDARIVAYGVFKGPKEVLPGSTFQVYDWAREAYVNQPVWEEVVDTPPAADSTPAPAPQETPSQLDAEIAALEAQKAALETQEGK